MGACGGCPACTAVQRARQCRAHGCRMQGACRAGEAARAHWTRALSPGSPRAEPCHRILSASCSSRLLRAAASLCCSCSHWASAVSILFRDAFVFGRSRMLGRCGGLTSVPACIAPVRCKRAGSTRGRKTPADGRFLPASLWDRPPLRLRRDVERRTRKPGGDEGFVPLPFAPASALSRSIVAGCSPSSAAARPHWCLCGYPLARRRLDEYRLGHSVGRLGCSASLGHA